MLPWSLTSAALELNVSKTSVLPKGVTQQAAFDAAHNIIHVTPVLTHLGHPNPLSAAAVPCILLSLSSSAFRCSAFARS
jgi:hypothetical protein